LEKATGVPSGPGARRDAGVPVGPDHSLQRLLDSPNPFWSRGDLWRAIETYLGLWGSAYWGLERDGRGQVTEIWTLRSDRMRVVPDAERYVKGFVYVGQGQQLVPYVPEDIVWMRYFNPLDEYAGLSPIAPLRLSADMGLDALRANRNNLTNESTPGVFIETADTPTDDEVHEFYERWESRYRGVTKVRRPVLLSGGMKAANLGFRPRDMEYIQSLRWSLEDVARVYGVPKPMMGDVERATFSNFQTARRVFWEDTIVPHLNFYQEFLQQMLLPNLGTDATGLFVEFDTSHVEALQESENDKAQRRRTYVSAGIMTINEVRREMNMPPVGWGDAPPVAAAGSADTSGSSRSRASRETDGRGQARG
jgi:HK97 family phage portal protein